MNILVLACCLCCVAAIQSSTCDRGEIAERNFLLYDVNHGEGFNLRRDVYMRIAVLVKNLQQYGDWTLVLPPWGPLPHWKSRNIENQFKIPWKKFFDVPSLQKYVPVIDLSELIKDKVLLIDQLVVLQHYENAWEDGKWVEKFEYAQCSKRTSYEKSENGKVNGWFWGYHNIQARNMTCLSFQGHSKKLMPLIKSLCSKAGCSLKIDRAEIPLHDEYGNNEYWKVRRSMRFASSLYKIANQYRREFLNSDDQSDGTKLPMDWRDETDMESPKGGAYICGHLRRQDFLQGRPKDVPSMKSASKQLKRVAKALNLDTIFIASDGTEEEMEELRKHLGSKYRLMFYRPSVEVQREILDGGVAIVDQIICSRARHFIGSYESTFSFRIQEEREILHFTANSTFNRLCGDEQRSCEQPAKWKIVMS